MKKLFRIIYPFFMYVGISYLVMMGAVFIGTAVSKLVMPDGNAAFITSLVFDQINRLSVYLTALAAVITSVFLYHCYRQDTLMRGRAAGGLRVPGGWNYLVFIGIFLCIFGNNLIEMIRLDNIFSGYQEVSEVLYSVPLWSQILCIGILIPIGEEMVFRVMIFRRLRDVTGFLQAALISSLVFAVYHGNVTQGIYAFLLAVVMAYVYEISDDPLTPIAVHGVANLTSVIFTALPGSVTSPGNLILAVETFLSLAVILYSLKRYQAILGHNRGG